MPVSRTKALLAQKQWFILPFLSLWLCLGQMGLMPMAQAADARLETCASLLPPTDPELNQLYTVQLDKNTFRGVRQYGLYLIGRPTANGSLTNLLMKATGEKEPVKKLPQLLAGLQRQKGSTLKWADEGAGFSIVSRELKRDHPKLMSRVYAQAVDQFDWDQYGKDIPNYSMIKNYLGEEILNPGFKPVYVLGDMASVTPPGQDLITSVESIQYAPDKLRAMSDWYNKLADGGLMIVATEHDWTREILFKHPAPEFLKNEGRGFEMTPYLLKALSRAGIEFGYWGTAYTPAFPKITKLAIRKKPGTRMEIKVPLVDKWVNGYNYVFSYYQFNEDPIAIIATSPQ